MYITINNAASLLVVVVVVVVGEGVVERVVVGGAVVLQGLISSTTQVPLNVHFMSKQNDPFLSFIIISPSSYSLPSYMQQPKGRKAVCLSCSA